MIYRILRAGTRFARFRVNGALVYFDPPWTPACLRRNEVMLRTQAGQR